MNFSKSKTFFSSNKSPSSSNENGQRKFVNVSQVTVNTIFFGDSQILNVYRLVLSGNVRSNVRLSATCRTMHHRPPHHQTSASGHHTSTPSHHHDPITNHNATAHRDFSIPYSNATHYTPAHHFSTPPLHRPPPQPGDGGDVVVRSCGVVEWWCGRVVVW